MVLLLMSVVYACTKDSENKEQLEVSDIVDTGKTFAMIHNECLASIYDSLAKENKTRSIDLDTQDFKDHITSLTTKYIKANVPQTRNSNLEIDYSVLDMSTSDIMDNMSEKEIGYINEAMEEGVDIEELMIKVSNDETLQTENKQAVICFISTYQASSEYWKQHIDEWMNLLGNNTTRAGFHWRNAAIADAMFGYQAMLMTGFNIYISGGVAAAGSVLSGL